MTWTKVELGGITFYASVNYRGNIVVADDVSENGTRKELVPDLEYQTVIVV